MFESRILRIMLAVGMIGISACNSNRSATDDPKQRLTEYISRTFAVKGIQDREQLLSFLTGDVRTRLENWSEDQFLGAFVNSKREFLKLSFQQIKPVSESETEITYELTYLEGGNQDAKEGNRSKVTNKKYCRVIKQQGKWMISEVRNIKELIEFQNELALP